MGRRKRGKRRINVLGRDLSKFWTYSVSLQMVKIRLQTKRKFWPVQTSKTTEGIPVDLDTVCNIVLKKGFNAYLEYRKKHPYPDRLKPRPDGEPRLPPLPKLHKIRTYFDL